MVGVRASILEGRGEPGYPSREGERRGGHEWVQVTVVQLEKTDWEGESRGGGGGGGRM